jgi:hypothetical protein
MVYILVVVAIMLLIVVTRFILVKRRRLGEFIIDAKCDTSNIKPCDADEVDNICADRFHADLLRHNTKVVKYNDKIDRLAARYSLLIMDKIRQYAREHGYICGKFYIRTHELLSLPVYEVKPELEGLDIPGETLTTVRLARDICTELFKHKYNAYIKTEKDCAITVSWSTCVPRIFKEKYTAPDTYIV